MARINGRIISVPDSGLYGEELVRELRPAPGRRAVFQRGGTAFETVEPNRRYTKRELMDRKGQPVKVTDIPDRTKGAFGAPRCRPSDDPERGHPA